MKKSLILGGVFTTAIIFSFPTFGTNSMRNLIGLKSVNIQKTVERAYVGEILSFEFEDRHVVRDVKVV